LLTLPAAPGRGHDTGVSFTRVAGESHRSGERMLRTNPIEAAAVVEEVLRRGGRCDLR